MISLIFPSSTYFQHMWCFDAIFYWTGVFSLKTIVEKLAEIGGCNMSAKTSRDHVTLCDDIFYCALVPGEPPRSQVDVGKVLGVNVSFDNPLDAIQIIRSGLPIKALRTFSKTLSLTNGDLAHALSLSPRTIKRYHEKKETELLSSEVSEHLIQLTELFAKAVEVFGDREQALNWLREPIPGLGGEMPISILDTTVGIELVKNELTNIDHGIFA